MGYDMKNTLGLMTVRRPMDEEGLMTIDQDQKKCENLDDELFPDTPTNDHETLAAGQMLDRMKQNPNENYSVRDMLDYLNDACREEYTGGMEISDNSVRRKLTLLSQKMPGVVLEIADNGEYLYHFDPEIAAAAAQKSSKDFVEIYATEILLKHKDEALKVSQISDILSSEYYLNVDRNKLARILNTICYYDAHLFRIQKGREFYYIASAQTPEGYISAENIDRYFDRE